MPTNYERYCAIARTIEAIGERWTMLILRDLRSGPRKFHELESSLQGISPNTLSKRLRALEENGIVLRRFYEDHPPRAEYLLTPKGEELRGVLRALQDWGLKYPTPASSRRRGSLVGRLGLKRTISSK